MASSNFAGVSNGHAASGDPRLYFSNQIQTQRYNLSIVAGYQAPVIPSEQQIIVAVSNYNFQMSTIILKVIMGDQLLLPSECQLSNTMFLPQLFFEQ